MPQVDTMQTARVGDIYKFYYTVRGRNRQAAVANTAHELDKDQRWSVVKAEQPAIDKVIFTVRIDKNPFPVAVIVGAIAAIAGSFFLYLSLDKVEQISNNPIGSIFLIGAGAFLLMSSIKQGKKLIS